MKVTIRELVNAEVAINELGKLKGIPTRLSYKIGCRNARKINTIISDFRKKQKELLETYNKKQEDGTYIITDKYRDEIDILLDLEEDIDLWMVDISELPKKDVQPEIFEKLYFMFEDKEEKSKKKNKRKEE